MRNVCRALLPIAVVTSLLGCGRAPLETPAAPGYRVGETLFSLDGADVLQTWPVLPYRTPPSFMRLALQMPPDALVPGLDTADGDVIQIDVLAPAAARRTDAMLGAGFTDWKGRETAPAGTRYHYDPKSLRLKDGGRALYRRQSAPIAGLEILSPETARGAAPEFFIARDGATITAAIDCREVPPGYGSGEYCSLWREGDSLYGYRVMFRRDRLADWRRIDEGARKFLAAAARF
jgi:hypothetical protein